MNRQLYLKIEKPKEGRRFVMSDIHGCAKTFKALLKQINLKKRDHLYLIGDLINRGPSSNRLLDYIIKLKEKGYQLFLLRGNHEDIILKAEKNTLEFRSKIFKIYRAENLLDDEKLIQKKYKELLESCYYYFVLDDYYLVHAGFNFNSETPFDDTHFMLYSKKFKLKNRNLENRKVVIGHTPKRLSSILKRIKAEKRKIYIDNGCVNFKAEEQGNLLCLNLDNLGISIVRNIDQ